MANGSNRIPGRRVLPLGSVAYDRARGTGASRADVIKVSLSSLRPAVMYWRTHRGDAVDFVLEFANGDLIAIECKGGSRPGHDDARSLRLFIEEYGRKVRGALLLHGGSETYRLGDRILATPWWRIA